MFVAKTKEPAYNLWSMFQSQYIYIYNLNKSTCSHEQSVNSPKYCTKSIYFTQDGLVTSKFGRGFEKESD